MPTNGNGVRTQEQGRNHMGLMTCQYCNDFHHLRGECEKLKRHIQEGWVYISPRGTIAWADNKVDLQGFNFSKQVEQFKDKQGKGNLVNGPKPPTCMVCSVHMRETEEQTVSAFLANKPQDMDMNKMSEKANSNFLIYQEMTKRANDLLMDAFVSGTTEVLNSVLLNHLEIFKRHRFLQLNS
ncbi:hypothetical protein HMI55_001772 [Coelomomyces lativittatus]|nr:hypothetical protein HMI55_001772 [Coelomomyces lativittatus]